MSNGMIKAPSECQFHNNCGGWCEALREVEHNLCADCLETHDEDVCAKPEPVLEEGDTVQKELRLLNFALSLLAQLEQLRGLRPALPPRPPEGNGLPRYGLRWNGPQEPLATPMDDGYWTPWHLANELRKDAERYQWLRSRDLETINHGGVFAGITPQNMVLNEETLDEAIDAARAQEAL